MKVARITRRIFLEGGLGFTVANFVPWSAIPRAFAAAEDDNIIKAAKSAGNADLRGMIWSNYYAAMQAPMEEFKKQTGIGVGNIQDISIFDAPQRAMAEALSRSPQFDFFHIDSNMIPSLASAGLLEPLDDYMKKAGGFKINAVGDYANFMTYKGKTYGVPTDGNVHIEYLRKDLMEDADNQKRFEDKNGKKLAYPQTWDEEFAIQKFFHNPDKDLYGSGSLRNRANGPTWWYMMFYSAGGFPFDDDMNPTIDNAAGAYAVETYLQEKQVAHPESAGWGTPQMIPRIFGGKVVSCQYWDGTIGQNEKEGSPTKGKWLYGLVPGSDKSGRRIYRSVSSPLAAVLVNKYSPRKAQAAYLALWWGTLQNSTKIVSDVVVSFHDPWHDGHMTAPSVVSKYTPEGIKAIKSNLQVVSPPIYLTGYLEFQDTLGKNLSEAYVGQLPAKDVLKRTTEEWKGIVNRIGKRKLRDELASYKAVMPKGDKPA
jgi:multiple sugar transport system substrate-binding protein